METRTKQPKGNKYYIRKASGGYSSAIKGYPTISGADVLCNCVGYAGSRFNEVIGKGYEVYKLVCNAEDFIEAAKRQGLKISTKPVQGGIIVWAKGKAGVDRDGAGHVAFVEEVYEDGSILTSESGYGAWAFKNVHRTNDNGNWGQSSAYWYRGCIVNPYVDGKVAPAPLLVVDGIGGPATVRAMQQFFNTPQDGVISGQNKSLKGKYPSLTSVTFGGGGSVCIKKLQKWLGVTADGVLGEQTIKAWQKKLFVTADGIFGKRSMKAWQTFLNNQINVPVVVLDVSEFQDSINWKRLKETGIEGVIVRCGYRGAEKGTLKSDSRFLEHIQGAASVGLKVGIYMFTEGINASEGKAEADFAIRQLKSAGVKISYPIAVDTEAVNIKNERARNLTKAQRTAVIKAFCEEIKAQGYEPMIYASVNWLNNKLDMSKLPYKVWVAQYNSKLDYDGDVALWQWTSQGTYMGVNGNVDVSYSYL